MQICVVRATEYVSPRPTQNRKASKFKHAHAAEANRASALDKIRCLVARLVMAIGVLPLGGLVTLPDHLCVAGTCTSDGTMDYSKTMVHSE